MRSESRSSLYYNAYEYAMTWRQDEIGCIRSLDQKKMQSHIRVRMEYEHSRNNHYQRYGEKFESKFTTRCRDNLEGMRALLATEIYPKKMVFFNSYLTVYTNNLGLHGRLMACDWIESVDLKRAELNLPPDTILLKNPQYQYRTYFRGRNLGKQQKARLATWIQTQGSEIAASKSLREFLDIETRPTRVYWWRSEATESYYYIEHNSLQYETMLSMICPGMVRKTMPIVKKQ
jgi:hypothetical protein